MIKLFSSCVFLFSFFLTLMLFSDCRKSTSTTIETNTYLRSFNSVTDEQCFYMHYLPGNGFIFISSTDHDIINLTAPLIISKMDINGIMQMEKTVDDTFIEPQATPLKDGSLLISSGSAYGNLAKIDKNGVLNFETRFVKFFSLRDFSYPIESADGHYYIASTDARDLTAPTVNKILKFEQDGNYLQSQDLVIDDTVFGG